MRRTGARLALPVLGLPLQIGSGLLRASLLPDDAAPIRRHRSVEAPMTPAPEVATSTREVAMIRRRHPWIAAAVAIAATGLMIGLAITATTGVNPSHIHMPDADSNGVTL